jgi:hypothetical protein
VLQIARLGSDIAPLFRVRRSLTSHSGICFTGIVRSTLTIAAGALGALAAIAAAPASVVVPDVDTVMQNSIAATHQNWAVSAQFDRCERDVTRAGTKTYAVTMILGSSYSRLTAVDDKPISEADRQRQHNDEDLARMTRASEAPDERARRIEKYERKSRRIRLGLDQFPYAFDFTSEGTQRTEGFDVYVIHATPKGSYRPTSSDSEVLKGTDVRLWIEQNSFQWVKVEASVVHPVSIAGFFASIEPGTRFSLEQRPVEPDVWLPTHFSMRTRARVLFLLRQRSDVDETYFDYRRVESEASRPDTHRDDACLPTVLN